jgi:D-lactate dehydrogenase (cytochrome)
VNDASAFLDRLAQIVGAANVVVDPDLVAPYLEEPRGLFRGRAIAVVRPGSTAEVAAVVSACAAADVAIVPQAATPAWSAARFQTPAATSCCCR